MTLEEYIEATEASLRGNPPRNNPRYAEDPIGVWRYYMRCFGAGLSIYNETEAINACKALYSRWFIRLEFNQRRPNIDNKQFMKWIIESRKDTEP